jgi:hypothetical protein
MTADSRDAPTRPPSRFARWEGKRRPRPTAFALRAVGGEADAPH